MPSLRPWPHIEPLAVPGPTRKLPKPGLRGQSFMAVIVLSFSMLALLCVALMQYIAYALPDVSGLYDAPTLWSNPSTGQHIWAPWLIFEWLEHPTVQANEKVSHVVTTLLQVGACGIFGLAGILLTRPRFILASDVHGSARWRTSLEIAKDGMLASVDSRLPPAAQVRLASLLGSMGLGALYAGAQTEVVDAVTLAKLPTGHQLQDNSFTHTLLVGPTGGGKGVGVVIPTLLSWKGSLVCTDIKGENWELTAKFRQSFGDVVYFNPCDPNTSRYNPLLEVRRGPEAVRDVQNIMTILGAKEKRDEYWDGGAERLVSMLALHALYASKEPSFALVLDMLSDFTPALERIKKTRYPEPGVERYIRNIQREFSAMIQNKATKQVASFVSVAQGLIALWNDPILAEATRTSDFRLRDLQFGERPVTVYFVIPPGDIQRLSPLVRVFFEQLTDLLTEDERAPGRHQRLLMMLDEFPRFGAMRKVKDALTYARSYKIKYCVITQGITKLEEVYGQHQDFVDNCHTRIFMAANDSKNAEYISKSLGETTALKKSVGQSGEKRALSNPLFKNANVSYSEFGRPLMLSGELMDKTFDDRAIIIQQAGKSPIFAHKITYYNDPAFMPRFVGKKMPRPSKRPEPLKFSQPLVWGRPLATVEHEQLVPKPAGKLSRQGKDEFARAAPKLVPRDGSSDWF